MTDTDVRSRIAQDIETATASAMKARGRGSESYRAVLSGEAAKAGYSGWNEMLSATGIPPRTPASPVMIAQSETQGRQREHYWTRCLLPDGPHIPAIAKAVALSNEHEDGVKASIGRLGTGWEMEVEERWGGRGGWFARRAIDRSMVHLVPGPGFAVLTERAFCMLAAMSRYGPNRIKAFSSRWEDHGMETMWEGEYPIHGGRARGGLYQQAHWRCDSVVLDGSRFRSSMGIEAGGELDKAEEKAVTDYLQGFAMKRQVGASKAVVEAYAARKPWTFPFMPKRRTGL